MKVLVTGGTGFLGKALKAVKPKWFYNGLNNGYNLISYQDTLDMLDEYEPDAIVHLAARVGGILANNNLPETFFYENLMINSNVVRAAVECGVERLLAAASTCAFPDTVSKYPMIEEDLHNGAPTITNLGYGYAKRMLIVHVNACRKQHNVDYSTFCPTNLYGPGDNFDTESGHFISALIRKVAHSKDGDTIEFLGTGKPLKQELYVDDLANIIPLLLAKHHSDVPVIVTPDRNLTIKDYVDIVLKISGKDLNVIFNGQLEGQYRKDGSNKELIRVLEKPYSFILIEDGLKETYEWYMDTLYKENGAK